ncbi:hypothetical protein BCR44DRAFT_91875 [Catenaria anguillulae PL171]|uniref:Protein kinase domain-containing protein n=1 Tax=Catenaria anguillulae PL171 TaxID=765915 RepID=A0A1Y2HVS1_9FUNG|nr:hypothetical protein BCR44DRAFT_91875 [Catenaria anguillulae PL171]
MTQSKLANVLRRSHSLAAVGSCQEDKEVVGPNSPLVPAKTDQTTNNTDSGTTLPTIDHESALGAEYKIDRTLGAGNFASVSLVVAKKTGLRYACKMIDAKQAPMDPWQEVTIMQQLSHANVLSCIDALESNGHIYIVMRLGTLTYTAPELLDAKVLGRGVDLKLADMWSVGATAFVVLTKKLPFRPGKNLAENILTAAVPYGIKSLDRHPSAAKAWLQCLLERDICKRLTADRALKHPWLATDASVHEAAHKALTAVNQRKQGATNSPSRALSSGSSVVSTTDGAHSLAPPPIATDNHHTKLASLVDDVIRHKHWKSLVVLAADAKSRIKGARVDVKTLMSEISEKVRSHSYATVGAFVAAFEAIMIDCDKGFGRRSQVYDKVLAVYQLVQHKLVEYALIHTGRAPHPNAPLPKNAVVSGQGTEANASTHVAPSTMATSVSSSLSPAVNHPQRPELPTKIAAVSMAPLSQPVASALVSATARNQPVPVSNITTRAFSPLTSTIPTIPHSAVASDTESAPMRTNLTPAALVSYLDLAGVSPRSTLDVAFSTANGTSDPELSAADANFAMNAAEANDPAATVHDSDLGVSSIRIAKKSRVDSAVGETIERVTKQVEDGHAPISLESVAAVADGEAAEDTAALSGNSGTRKRRHDAHFE